jgi:hypothetical protein
MDEQQKRNIGMFFAEPTVELADQIDAGLRDKGWNGSASLKFVLALAEGGYFNRGRE